MRNLLILVSTPFIRTQFTITILEKQTGNKLDSRCVNFFRPPHSLSMKIPLVNLNKQHKPLLKEIYSALKKILTHSSFIKGPYLNKFEENYAKFIGAKYAIGVASGTDALQLGLMALDLQPDDEVIMPVNTFIATAYAAIYLNAKPIFVDIDETTFNIDVNQIEQKITGKTKVIIPVHLYGQSAEMNKILKIARKHNLKVFDDASQAHGAYYKKNRIGSLGNLTAFSLYPSKNLGACGDAGIITTNSSKIAQRLLSLREYGGKSKYFYDEIGLNSRLDSIQASILSIKLKHLSRWNKERQKIAKYYNQELIKLKIPGLLIPHSTSDTPSVYYVYVIRAPYRDKLLKHLNDRGIQSGIHYPIPLHLQQSLNFLQYQKGDFPIAEKTCSEILSLPIFPGLTPKQQKYVVTAIKDFYAQN